MAILRYIIIEREDKHSPINGKKEHFGDRTKFTRRNYIKLTQRMKLYQNILKEKIKRKIYNFR